ncbi:MAG TPA: class I SAM-dependent methyltransferase [Eoetvoesiella sp.]|uniref:class I SAM-dependent methyltransferase n=1 Tax=Eoetvoesiella sp. TaxID=1966355 RepID=UPI002B62CED7|nr:class I SAM-dependent methyltransferase [Eoetvoesiella sp.]HWK60363.1 class I SAM-dependent methyltransferase [Eoetvoesiella sp.]
MRNQTQVVSEQYNPVAGAYLTSAVHAQGQDLQDLAALAQAHPGARVLDLGCGAGHVSFAVAPFVDSVVPYDLSREMVALVQRTAAERGLNNIRAECGVAEALPFEPASFDIVLTRFSAHHWVCIQTVAEQIMRVLKPGGKLVVIDVVTPQNALLTTYMQSIELLRDTSHVRNRSVSDWEAVLKREGFQALASRQWKLPLNFANWVERMQTPAERVAAIVSLLQAAPAEVLEYFEVQADNSFVVDTAWVEAVKPA